MAEPTALETQVVDPLAGFDRGEDYIDPLLQKNIFDPEPEDEQEGELPEEKATIPEETPEAPDPFKERQAAFTRKEQEVAEMRRTLEERERTLQEQAPTLVLDAFYKSPVDVQRQIIQELAGKVGVPIGDVQEPAEWASDGEKFLYHQNQQLRQQLQAISPVLEDLRGFVASQKANSAFTEQSALASQAIHKATGHAPTVDELKAAVAASGISDPKSAWWSVNGEKVAQGAFQAGKSAQVDDKPNTPGNQGKTFDQFAKDENGQWRYTSQQIDAMVARGYTPIGKKPR